MSYTTNLDLFKHDNPSTNTDDFDVEQALNNNWNKIDEFAGTGGRVTELIEALTTPITGTGENITLNNTAKKRFDEFKVSGNTVQEGTPSPSNPSEIKNTGTNDINYMDESILASYKGSENDECYIYTTDTLYNKNLTPNVIFKPYTSYVVRYIAKQSSGNPRLIVRYTDGSYMPFGTQVISNTTLTEYKAITDNSKSVNYITENYGAYSANFLIKKNSTLIKEGNSFTSENTTWTPFMQGKFTTKVENENNTEIQIVSFPLVNSQRLHKGDYLKEDGIHQVRKTVVFDGSSDEEWSAVASAEKKRFQITLTDAKQYNSSVVADVYCNRFIKNSADEIYRGQSGIAFNSNTIWLDDTYGSTIDGYTLDQFKTWLSSNPLTVEYELAEEVVIPYTDEQKKAYLQLQNLQSYEDKTFVYSPDNTSPIYEVEAVRSLDGIL